MESTMQLLRQALAINPKQYFWCEQLSISKHSIAVAKNRGRLSPVIAGNLAKLLGEDVTHWIAVAAMEAEPDTPSKKRLENSLKNWRKR